MCSSDLAILLKLPLNSGTYIISQNNAYFYFLTGFLPVSLLVVNAFTGDFALTARANLITK